MIVFMLCKGADWLQGPYIYALYEHYGFSHDAIGRLFIAGYGSSMVFGTFVGLFADSFGRKRNCLAYVVLYSISCVTKHFNNFHVLMFGRVLGGIATSILYSAFESWMVSEHKATAYPDDWLSQTFALITLGDGIMAIACGLLASVLVDGASLSMVAPFDAALFFLVAGAAVIAATWKENYGDRAVAVTANFSKATSTIFNNSKVALIGTVVSCYESSMYIFVFMWTPKLKDTLSATDPALPHGIIFASFMMCAMIGSQIYRTLTKDHSDEHILRGGFVVAAAAMAISALSDSNAINMGCFFAFEVTVGLYWPSIGSVRAKHLPQETRATMMNIFRIGLNFIVIAMLYHVDMLTHRRMFLSIALLLAMGGVCTHLLAMATSGSKASQAAALTELAGQDVDDATIEFSAADAKKDRPAAGGGGGAAVAAGGGGAAAAAAAVAGGGDNEKASV